MTKAVVCYSAPGVLTLWHAKYYSQALLVVKEEPDETR